MKRKKHRTLSTYVYYLAMLAYLVVIAYPLYLMVVTSLKPNAEIFKNPLGPPQSFYLGNFITLISRANFNLYFLNSLIVVFVSLFCIIIFSSLAAFILAKHGFKGSTFLYSFFVAGLIIPIRLGTISILKMMIGFGLHDTLASVILVSIATGIPFGIFILTDFIRMVPDDLMHAARIDGYSEPKIFLRIIIPLLLPAIASVAVVNFIPIWNDFWFPLILLKSQSVRTVPLATALLFGQFSTNYGHVFAMLTMASVPVVITYLIFSRWFIKGLTEGGLKG
ncbi:MAG TPA: carbohydrate ABC transporter permease [Sphaerochaeta sp.]|jgi:raffinose/stachyose/melibiose transport system permease protein|nr:carbohydrate ABC transporter permease [Sphaerochaeta sp.]HPY44782.1 carbohydrate ABC transporter permease [Sphaerochaeta sp.]HQB04728.1 carbohydrate ABC transporter permease [Sphaerochaeta sp.]